MIRRRPIPRSLKGKERNSQTMSKYNKKYNEAGGPECSNCTDNCREVNHRYDPTFPKTKRRRECLRCDCKQFKPKR